MPMTWNAEADARLFAAVIRTSEGIKFDYSEIAKYMGPDCTPKAVTHRISNIKAIVKTLVPDGETPGAAIGNGAAPKTPNTPKKRHSADANGNGDGSPTPNKKARGSSARKPRDKKASAASMDTKGDAEVVKMEAVKMEAVNDEKVKVEEDSVDAGQVGADDEEHVA